MNVNINLNNKSNKFDGWGISVGKVPRNPVGFQKKISQNDKNLLVSQGLTKALGTVDSNAIQNQKTLLFSSQGLNLNSIRVYMIGGDDPSHTHMSIGPGFYQDSSMTTISQTFIDNMNYLQTLIQNNITHLEAFFYTPPYWMTISGCTAGSINGSENVSDTQLSNYAQYIINVLLYCKNTFNIIFNTVSIINEPSSNWWQAFGRQEGCAFGIPKMINFLQIVYNLLKRNNINTLIVLPENNDVYNASLYIKALIQQNSTILNMIGSFNIHTYFGNIKDRQNINMLSKSLNIPIVVSEYGYGTDQSENTPMNKQLNGGIGFSKHICKDINYLQPIRWTAWNLYWGLSQNGNLTKMGYAWKHFTNNIIKGSSFIYVDSENYVIAITPNNSIVIIYINDTNNNININFNFSNSVLLTQCIITDSIQNYKTQTLLNNTFNTIQSFTFTGLSITTLIYSTTNLVNFLENTKTPLSSHPVAPQTVLPQPVLPQVPSNTFSPITSSPITFSPIPITNIPIIKPMTFEQSPQQVLPQQVLSQPVLPQQVLSQPVLPQVPSNTFSPITSSPITFSPIPITNIPIIKPMTFEQSPQVLPQQILPQPVLPQTISNTFSPITNIPITFSPIPITNTIIKPMTFEQSPQQVLQQPALSQVPSNTFSPITFFPITNIPIIKPIKSPQQILPQQQPVLPQVPFSPITNTPIIKPMTFQQSTNQITLNNAINSVKKQKLITWNCYGNASHKKHSTFTIDSDNQNYATFICNHNTDSCHNNCYAKKN
jgi:O-glycosyl hydrolase